MASYGGMEIKAFHSDNGGEFMSKEYHNLIRDMGARKTTIVARSPNMNPLAESAFFRIFSMVRALLKEAGLPENLWPFAYLQSILILNRTPRKRFEALTTAYEMINHRKPNLNFIKIFGCRAPAMTDSYACWYTVSQQAPRAHEHEVRTWTGMDMTCMDMTCIAPAWFTSGSLPDFATTTSSAVRRTRTQSSNIVHFVVARRLKLKGSMVTTKGMMEHMSAFSAFGLIVLNLLLRTICGHTASRVSQRGWRASAPCHACAHMSMARARSPGSAT